MADLVKPVHGFHRNCKPCYCMKDVCLFMERGLDFFFKSDALRVLWPIKG